MKKLLITMMLFALMSLGVTQAAVVKKIAGLKSECDTTNAGCNPIPLAVSSVCITGCPLNTAPDLVVSTRFWGIASGVNCRVSNNSGVTWGACTTTPLAGNFTTRRHIAGAADGSVIVIGDSSGTCTVRRSTDAGTSWSTVFTVPGNACTGGITGRTLLKCKSNGMCVFVSFDNNTGLPLSLISTDSGVTWVATTLGNVRSSSGYQQFAYNGSIGGQYIGGNGRGYLVSGTTFTETGVWPTLGFTVSCFGSYILGSTREAMCLDSSVELFKRYSTTGTFVGNVSVPLGRTSSGFSDQPITEGFGSSVIYLATTQITDGTGTGIGIWVSTDSGANFTNLFTSSRPNEITPNTAGDVNTANGCIYFSGGSPTIFIKVC